MNFYSTHAEPAKPVETPIQLAQELLASLQPGQRVSLATKRPFIPKLLAPDDPILEPLPAKLEPRGAAYAINGPRSRYTISKIMTAMILEKQYDKTVRYYNYKLRSGLKPDLRILTTRLRLCVTVNDAEGAIRVLRQASRYRVRPNREFFNLMIAALAKSPQHTPWVPRVVEKMHLYGLDVDSESYVALMTGYVETDQIKSALNLYLQMEQSLVRLPPQLEIRFITALKRVGAYEEAERIFEPLWKRVNDTARRVEFESAVLSEIGTVGVHLYLSMGQSQKALAFWTEMRSKGVRPAGNMIVQLAEAFKAHGMVGMARSLFQQVRFQVTPTLELYNVMIDIYGRHVSATAALNKFEQLRRLYTPDKNTLKSLLSMLLHLVVTRTDQVDLEAVLKQTKSLLEQFSSQYNVEATAHEDVAAVLTQLFASCGEVPTALACFAAFREKDRRRSLLVPVALLQGLRFGGKISFAQHDTEIQDLRARATSALDGIETSRLTPSDLLLSEPDCKSFATRLPLLLT